MHQIRKFRLKETLINLTTIALLCFGIALLTSCAGYKRRTYTVPQYQATHSETFTRYSTDVDMETELDRRRRIDQKNSEYRQKRRQLLKEAAQDFWMAGQMFKSIAPPPKPITPHQVQPLPPINIPNVWGTK